MLEFHETGFVLGCRKNIRAVQVEPLRRKGIQNIAMCSKFRPTENRKQTNYVIVTIGRIPKSTYAAKCMVRLCFRWWYNLISFTANWAVSSLDPVKLIPD